MSAASEDARPSSRESIFLAAQALMSEIGYEKTSIAMICERAGLPVGSVYHHFGSKAALLAEVVERNGEQFWAEFTEAEATLPTGTADERLRWFFDVTVRAVTNNISSFRLSNDMYRVRETDPVVAVLADSTTAYARDRLTGLLEASLTAPGAVFPRELARRLAEVVILFTRGLTVERHGSVAETRTAYDDLYAALRPSVRGFS